MYETNTHSNAKDTFLQWDNLSNESIKIKTLKEVFTEISEIIPHYIRPNKTQTETKNRCLLNRKRNAKMIYFSFQGCMLQKTHTKWPRSHPHPHNTTSVFTTTF